MKEDKHSSAESEQEADIAREQGRRQEATNAKVEQVTKANKHKAHVRGVGFLERVHLLLDVRDRQRQLLCVDARIQGKH